MAHETQIAALLLDRIAAFPGAPPIAFPDVAFTPPAGVWFEVAYLMNSPEDAFHSDDAAATQRGILQITVVMRGGGGVPPGLALAGGVVAWFLRGLTLRGDGVNVRVTGTPDISSPRMATDGTRIAVSVPWMTLT